MLHRRQRRKLITAYFSVIVIDHTPTITQGANRRGPRCCFTHGQNNFHTIIEEPFISITSYFIRQCQISCSILTHFSSFIHRLYWLDQNTEMYPLILLTRRINCKSNMFYGKQIEKPQHNGKHHKRNAKATTQLQMPLHKCIAATQITNATIQKQKSCFILMHFWICSLLDTSGTSYLLTLYYLYYYYDCKHIQTLFNSRLETEQNTKP